MNLRTFTNLITSNEVVLHLQQVVFGKHRHGELWGFLIGYVEDLIARDSTIEHSFSFVANKMIYTINMNTECSLDFNGSETRKGSFAKLVQELYPKLIKISVGKPLPFFNITFKLEDVKTSYRSSKIESSL